MWKQTFQYLRVNTWRKLSTKWIDIDFIERKRAFMDMHGHFEKHPLEKKLKGEEERGKALKQQLS